MSLRPERIDRLLDALSHHRRRRLLVALDARTADGGSPADVDALCRAVAPDGDASGFRIEALHRHLPNLDDAGIVDWDRRAGTVRRGPAWGAIDPLLRTIDERVAPEGATGADPPDRAGGR